MKIFRILGIALIIALGTSTAIWYASSVLNSASHPRESKVGVPRVAVLTSHYNASTLSGYEQRLVSYLSYSGAIVSYIDFRDTLNGGLTRDTFDLLTVSDGISLWDLGYIPQNVTDAISRFSSSGGGLLWFGHGGTLNAAGRFAGIDPKIERILGLSVKASATRTPVVELTQKGLDLASSLDATRRWLMPITPDISVRLSEKSDVLIRTLANETVLTISQGPNPSVYSLYSIDENMPSPFLSDQLWKNIVFSLAQLDPKYPVGIPSFFDLATMTEHRAAFAVRRDDYLVPNDEQILRLGFPVTILQWTLWFYGDPTIAPAYSRLLDLYDLEMAHHTWSHSSIKDMTPRVNYEMQQPITDIKNLFGVEPMVFGSPGGWSGFNASLVSGYSPPILMYNGWQAGLYPTPIGTNPSLLAGVVAAVRDMNTPWSNATLAGWYNSFSKGLQIHRMISTEWHPGTSTNNITQIETFLTWVKQAHGDVLVTSLGRMALLSHMRHSIADIKGTYAGNTYTLKISTTGAVYDLPLSVGTAVRSASLSDGRNVPFSDGFVVLPLMDKGTLEVKIEVGSAAYPELRGINMKQPFLPVIYSFTADKSSVTINLRPDHTWVINRPEWVDVTINSSSVKITGVQLGSGSSCDVTNGRAYVVRCLLGEEITLRISFSPESSSQSSLPALPMPISLTMVSITSFSGPRFPSTKISTVNLSPRHPVSEV